MPPVSIFLFFCLMIGLIEGNQEQAARAFLANFGQWLINHEQERRRHYLQGIDLEIAFKTIFENEPYRDVLAEWKTLKRICKEDGNGRFDLNDDNAPDLKRKTCCFLIPGDDSFTQQDYEKIKAFLHLSRHNRRNTPNAIIEYARNARNDNHLDLFKNWNKIVQVCNRVYEENVDKHGKQISKSFHACQVLLVPQLPPEER